jgi:hypothetical protein
LSAFDRSACQQKFKVCTWGASLFKRPIEYISARGLGIAIANAALKRDEPGIRLLKPKEAVFCAMKNFKMRALG